MSAVWWRGDTGDLIRWGHWWERFQEDDPFSWLARDGENTLVWKSQGMWWLADVQLDLADQRCGEVVDFMRVSCMGLRGHDHPHLAQVEESICRDGPMVVAHITGTPKRPARALGAWTGESRTNSQVVE